MKKPAACLLSILFLFPAMVYSLGKKPGKGIRTNGVVTDGLALYLSADRAAYGRYDLMIFTFSILNDRKEKVVSEKIFSDYVEPASVVALIATDGEGNRYSGYAGSRTDPGEEYDHYAIEILPGKTLSFSFFHRDLKKPIFKDDRPFAEIADRPGVYTIHALVQKDLLKTRFPLISNKFRVQVERK